MLIQESHLNGAGRMHVEHSVVEICVRIGASPSAQQPLPFPAAQKCDMLHQMRQPLLMLLLVH